MSATGAVTAAQQPFGSMSDATFTAALRQIIVTSCSTDQVQQRLKDELGYPFTIAITSRQPTKAADFEASVLAHLLGGLHLASGAMVMVMAHGSVRCNHQPLSFDSRRQRRRDSPYTPAGERGGGVMLK